MKTISLRPLLSALAVSAFTLLPVTGFAGDSVLKDGSVDSKFSSDNAPSVNTQAMKHGKKRPGLGDGMMVKMRKHPSAHATTETKLPTGPQPGAPPVPVTNPAMNDGASVK